MLAVPAVKLDQLDTLAITAYNHHEGYAQDLEPFGQAIDIGQREKTVTASFVIPTIIGLQIYLTTMKSRYNNNFINVLKTSLDK